MAAVSADPPANMEDITNSREIVRHQVPNKKKNMLVCSYCGKYFSHSAKLKNHLIFHTEARSFPCFLCDKAMSQTGHLKTHKIKGNVVFCPFI